MRQRSTACPWRGLQSASDVATTGHAGFQGWDLMHKSHIMVGTAATLVVAGLAGCTAQQATDSAHTAADAAGSANKAVLAALRTTSAKTQQAKSAEITLAVKLKGDAVAKSSTGTYAWGTRGTAFDVSMDAKDLGALSPGARTTMRFVGGAYYYRVKPQPEGPLKGKHWMKVDGSAISGAQGNKAFQPGQR
ncbi:hypothetical protein GCM10010278_63040 [Streptomyces melanogenes]|nr:hypothetical protein GCM10010278_63040 [Streptomyces melanogenes]